VTPSSAFRADARCLRLLADPIRLALLDALDRREQCVRDLKAEIGPIPDSKISYHLGLLQRAGLIVGTPRGTYRDYAITDAGRAVLRACRAVTAAFDGGGS
jgi:ArsR family transcriptional regulator